MKIPLIESIKLPAFWRNVDGLGYNKSIQRILWQSKKCKWNWIALTYGIRRSDIPQRFPVWNASNNSERSLIFGMGFWFVQFTYHRKGSFNQDRNFPFRKKLWKFYQLVS